MARVKKKEKILMPEEKLQQALVPESEQPYQVPENWRWVYLGETSEIIMGQSPDGLSTTNDTSFMPLIGGAADMGEMYPKASRYTKEPTKVSKTDDVILCIRATLGRPIFSDGQYCLGRGVAAIRSNAFIKEFVRFAAINFEQYLYDNATGTTFAQVSSNTLNKMPIPLPPLPEQHRIVNRIESLFAKLDEAKEKAQAVVDGYEDRKAAILHKAFTGELTEEWRERQGISAEKWKKKEIGKFAFVTKLAGFEYTKNIAPNLTDRGIPLFKGKNVQKGELVLEFESYIPKEVSDELSRSKLTRKCLLTPYVGTIGNIAIFDGTFEAHLGSNVGKIEINSDIIEEFLLYYLRSDLGYKELTKEKKATAQESISIQAIRNVIVPVPMRKEQERIVEMLDQLIGKEKQVEEIAVYTIEQIDTMKKSILARAFRGELGTNDPSDESAEELLKRIL